jgi:hypothetical protein
MDPIVLVIVIVVLMPIAVVWALAKSARLRGPAPRPESRRPVGTLVTDAVPEEKPEETADDGGPYFVIDSLPPEPDPELRARGPS